MTVTVTLTDGTRTNTIELVETERVTAPDHDGVIVTFKPAVGDYVIALTMLMHGHCAPGKESPDGMEG